MRSLKMFWKDDQGFLITTELVIVATIVVLGLIVGLSSIQTAVVFELNDIARALCSMNQSFFFPGTFACKGAFTSGSGFVDTFNCANCLGFGMGTGLGAGGFGGGLGAGGFGAGSSLGAFGPGF